MNFQIAKEKVLSELYISDMTDNRIYDFCLLEVFNNDVEKTDSFMLSAEMGYSRSDLRVIKKNRIRAKRKNWLTENQKYGDSTTHVFDSL